MELKNTQKLVDLQVERSQLKQERFSRFREQQVQNDRWYQSNIIRPQIEQRIREYDKEVEYSNQARQKHMKREEMEKIAKRQNEHYANELVKQQIKAKENHRKLIEKQKKADLAKVEQLTHHQNDLTLREREHRRQMRDLQRQYLDDQISKNHQLSATSEMNLVERALNRSDLHAYQSGVDKMQNLIPGIRSKVQPFAQSQL